MMRDDGWHGFSSAPNAGLVDGHGWTVPQPMRRAVVLAARAAGLTVDQWLTQTVAGRLNALGLARAALGPDNGDEYGQRVSVHSAMVRGMGRDAR